MSVSYLRDQFERSRRNLGLDAIDLLYLHNVADAQLAAVGPAEFDVRLERAFATLETFRAAGQLGSYGLATWDCLRTSPDAPGHFDLERALRLAESTGGKEHGFRFVQFPFNLAMAEAAAARTQRVGHERLSVFDAAHRLHLGVFTSVPLLQGQLTRHGPPRGGFDSGPDRAPVRALRAGDHRAADRSEASRASLREPRSRLPSALGRRRRFDAFLSQGIRPTTPRRRADQSGPAGRRLRPPSRRGRRGPPRSRARARATPGGPAAGAAPRAVGPCSAPARGRTRRSARPGAGRRT